jgi:hypothetical protein
MVIIPRVPLRSWLRSQVSVAPLSKVITSRPVLSVPVKA